MNKILDGFPTFLNSFSNVDEKVAYYGSLSRLLNANTIKHGTFKMMLNQAKLVNISFYYKDIQSKHPHIRMRSLTAFKLLVKFMTVNESVWFSLLYLADSNPEVLF